MKRFVLNSTVAAFALLTAGNAFANDYNSGVVTKTPSSGYTDVEFGSGWYLRGDITYNFRGNSETTGIQLQAPTGTLGVQADYDDSVGVRIGTGYYVNSKFRIEATAESILQSEFSGFNSASFGGSRVVSVQEPNPADPSSPIVTSDTIFFNSNGNVTGSTAGAYTRVVGNAANPISGSEEIDAEYNAVSFILNGYYDLPSFGAITPYVGAGVGLARVTYNQTRTLTCIPGGGDETCGFPAGQAGAETSQTLTLAEEYWAPAYQLSVGASYRVNERLSVDAGYSYTDYAGGGELNYDDGTAITDDGFEVHQVRAGIRYDLW